MNDDSTSYESHDSDESSLWRLLSRWPTIVTISIVLLILTFNPILTAFLPYIRAGWPSCRTAFWLKKADPWKARGTVGFLFHLCMALFSAGICAFICIVGTAAVAITIEKEPPMIPFMIAIATIALGCILMSILSWLAIAIAFRHHVRIFVVSNLYAKCRGDFAAAATLSNFHPGISFANLIIVVATVTPSLVVWFAGMVMTIPRHRNHQNETTLLLLLLSLPVLAIICIVIGAFLTSKIGAASPAECWGAEIPDPEITDSNWYRSHD